MSITVNEASGVLREGVRNTIRKHSLLYLVQGGVMVVAGIFALLFPLFMAAGFLVLLGWLLVASGLVQALSLVGATKVPYFWLQLVSVGLEVLVVYFLISNPKAGLVAVTYLMVVLFLVGGLVKVVCALMIRPMPDWGWLFWGRHDLNHCARNSDRRPIRGSHMVARSIARHSTRDCRCCAGLACVEHSLRIRCGLISEPRFVPVRRPALAPTSNVADGG